jgi:lipase maturation factor 1
MAGPRTYAFASWLFLRLLGFVYLTAFVSLAKQIRGLAGAGGILPAAEVLASNGHMGINRFWRLPTVCWLSTSDRFLLLLTWGGAVLSALLTAGVASAPLLILLWVFYLSLFNVCRLFLGYQWDVLLLEAGFLAILLAPWELWSRVGSIVSPPLLVIWLFWWLLFRLMFSSGFVKLNSGDSSWRKLRALQHHYETQPLPTPVAWCAHQLPQRLQKISTASVLLIELVGPVLMLGPAQVRYIACGVFVGLMLLIEITGNYAFFNVLGVALSVLLLDDDFWSALVHRPINARTNGAYISTSDSILSAVHFAIALVLLFLSCDVIAKLFRRPLTWPRLLVRCLEFLGPFHLVNGYGLFAVMTKERPEIIVEGSEDGVNWQAYEFKYKPGTVNRAPRFVAPHQPRLDWQVWFAALGYCENNPWFVRFLMRLLEGSKPVINLLKANPFPQRPPRYIRASLYDYRFTDRAQHRQSRAWWRREHRGLYCPVLDIPSGGQER